MEKYVDGYLLPIARDKIDQYREIAGKAGAIWMEHGALQYCECVGDDMQIKDMVSFTHSAGASPEETVIFAWIAYESREHRDRVNAAVMADPRMNEMMVPGSEPFDCKRMAYSGFKTLVNL